MEWNGLKKADNLFRNFGFPKTGKGWRFLSAFFIFSLLHGCASTPLPKVEAVNIDRFAAYEMPDGSKIYPVSVDETIPLSEEDEV